MTYGIDLDGRPCLIVGGAGGGIGTATSLAAAAAGAAVGIITHNPDHAGETIEQARSLGARCAVAAADVTDEPALVAAIARIAEELGTIRHVVNVIGGRTEYRRSAEIESEVFDRVVAYNLWYSIVSCHEVARELIRSGQSGSMVNVSSGASRGAPLLGSYGAAKAGLESFTRTMALEWGPRNIRVNAIGVGTIRTPRAGYDEMPEAAKSIPLRRRGHAVEVASTALFLLSDMSSYTTGQTVNVDGGVHLGAAGGDELSPFISRNSERRARFEGRR